MRLKFAEFIDLRLLPRFMDRCVYTMHCTTTTKI